MTAATRAVRPPRRSLPLAPWGMAAPAAAIVAVLAVLPLVYGVYLSLTNWSLLTSAEPHLSGLDAYRQLLGDPQFWSSLRRTLLWTAGTLVVEVVLGLPLALLLNRRTPVTGVVTGLLLVPWVTPFVVLAYAWLYLYDGSFGPFHAALQGLHLVGAGSPLGDPDRALLAVTAISGWKGVPFLTVALLAARKAIPDELYEAAAVDGAGRLAMFRRITLPLLLPTLVTMSFVLSVLAFYSFDLVWLTTKGGPGDTSTLLGVQLYQAFFTSGRPGYAAAIGTSTLVLFALVGLLVVLVSRRRRA